MSVELIIYSLIVFFLGVVLGTLLVVSMLVSNEKELEKEKDKYNKECKKNEERDIKISALISQVDDWTKITAKLRNEVYNMEDKIDRDRKNIKDLDEELQDYFEWITELDLLVKSKNKTRKKAK